MKCMFFYNLFVILKMKSYLEYSEKILKKYSNPKRFEFLKKYSECPEKIVLLGCGGGHNAFSLAKLYEDAKVYGIDKSKDMLRVARKNKSIIGSSVRFYEGSFLDFVISKPDIVCFINSLHFSRNIKLTLRFVSEKLNRNGIIFIDEPTEKSTFGAKLTKLQLQKKHQQLKKSRNEILRYLSDKKYQNISTSDRFRIIIML